MIVSLHVATGALAGALVGSGRASIPVGLALHLVGDVMPHRDLPSRRFEVASGLVGVVALGLRRGFGDPATVGAVASSIPDLEHLLPFPLAGGRKLFPSHRWASLHRTGGAPAGVQLAVSVGVLAAILARR